MNGADLEGESGRKNGDAYDRLVESSGGRGVGERRSGILLYMGIPYNTR